MFRKAQTGEVPAESEIRVFYKKAYEPLSSLDGFPDGRGVALEFGRALDG